MANPFAQALGGGNVPQGGPQGFIQFMNQMRGKDPNEIMQQMLSSGKISQSQLSQAQQMAKQMEGQLGGLKSMFGFK